MITKRIRLAKSSKDKHIAGWWLAFTALLVMLLSLAPIATSMAAPSYASQLTRYPYLTDVVGTNATVNFATDQSQTTATVKYGTVGNCTANTVNATKNSFKVYTPPYTGSTGQFTAEYQWKAQLPVSQDTQYCYRVFLGTGGTEIDLLGTDASPKFWSQLPQGSNKPFTFVVFGDWGSVDANGANTHQANLLSVMAGKNARFGVTVGDNSYATSGYLSTPWQTINGDLYQTGPSTSAVFGPNFWKGVGASLPLFPATGNHGFSSSDAIHPQILNWPQDMAVSTSGGRYTVDSYSGLNGINPANYPSTWYAFDAGNVRIYVLESVWADQNVGTADIYKNDYDYHLAPNTPQMQWLMQDLQSHPGGIKMAMLHFPFYADSNNQNDTSDTYLQGINNLEGIFHQYGVQVAFSGHAHFYERNIAPNSNSIITYVLGTGGAELTPVGTCHSYDAYAIGWSPTNSTGSACGAATKPTDSTQVYSFALVTVNGFTVTVTPVNENGQTFDVQTYDFTPVQAGNFKVFLPVTVK